VKEGGNSLCKGLGLWEHSELWRYVGRRQFKVTILWNQGTLVVFGSIYDRPRPVRFVSEKDHSDS
jgi:hypothetical protein